ESVQFSPTQLFIQSRRGCSASNGQGVQLGRYIQETEVAVHAESYLYGEEETYRATPEEVAYFMKRIEMDDTFLSRCDNIESVDFTINSA
ncbi:MAG: hypothetical protein KH352_04710, partial [Ruminococcus sp.]|nr:hypothetical protein [Candidatus Apopatosoma intestinale]